MEAERESVRRGAGGDGGLTAPRSELQSDSTAAHAFFISDAAANGQVFRDSLSREWW